MPPEDCFSDLLDAEDLLPQTGKLCSSQSKGTTMAKDSSRGGHSKSSNSSTGVSAARLHQKSGSSNSFGGYTKVNRGNGNFTMKKAGGEK